MGYVPDSPLPHASAACALFVAPSGQAHPEECLSGAATWTTVGGFDEEKFLAEGTDGTCLPAAVAANYDDSGAKLDVGQTGTKNLKLLANLPKTGALAGDANLNSDLAFKGDLAFQGNYNGIQITDISDPENPQIVSQIACPGSQNDISVWKDLLFRPTDCSRSDKAVPGNTALPVTEKAHGRASGSSTSSDPAQPALRRRGRDQVRLAHAHARAGRRPGAALRLVLRAERRRRWTASRRTT